MFKVTIQKVATVEPHPNADRLQIVKLNNFTYQFITVIGEFQEGELAIYFPLDSELPPELLEAVGLTDKLSGSKKNRVKTIKLRGVLSQGLLAPTELVGSYNLEVGQDVTALLGVTKYEPQVKPSKAGNLVSLAPFVGKYDLENAEKYPHLVELLMPQRVYISEKVEGSHWAATYYPKTREFVVSQRNFSIVQIDGLQHDWWKVAIEEGFEAKLQAMATRWPTTTADAITLRGEIVGPGIQGNYYGLKKHQVFAFELELGGSPLRPRLFAEICLEYDITTAPLLWSGPLDLQLPQGAEGLQAYSNGMSAINPKKRREGIVIKPAAESVSSEIGRLVLKQRSPLYLLKADC